MRLHTRLTRTSFLSITLLIAIGVLSWPLVTGKAASGNFWEKLVTRPIAYGLYGIKNTLGIHTQPVAITRMATLTVTSGGDNGAGTLRDTIAAAAPGDTIDFQAGVTTVTLTSGQLVINKNLTIDGGSGVTVARSSAGGTPDFRIFSIASDTTVTLNRLAVTNGKVSTSFAIGGGIHNSGTLNLMNCAVSGNSCNPTDGLRAAWAGGIFSNGSGTLNVINSTLSGNSTSGIDAEGGGIYSGNNVTLINSTITGNSASGITGSRGGCVFSGVGSVSIRNTIIAGNNTTISSDSPDVFGAVTSQGHNLIGKTDGSSGWVGTDLTGTIAVPLDALLAPLGNYGGPTQTHALLPGSPAINAGDNCVLTVNGCGANDPPIALTNDQRGVARVGAVDIGAFESRGFTMAITGGDNQSAVIGTNFLNPLAVTVASAFSEPVDGGQVTFTPPVSGASATIAMNLATIGGTGVATTGTVTPNGPPGTYSVTAAANGATGSASFLLTNTCPTITVTNPATATGTAGSAFSQTFTQVGGIGTTTFSTASALPTGLMLATNGTLSGPPTQTGTFPIVVKATDSNECMGTGTTYTLTIGCQTITVTNPATNIGTAGAAFSQTFTQVGGIGATTFSTASALPTGLTLAANGTLSGIPTLTGVFPITVKATDTNGCLGTASYTLQVVRLTGGISDPLVCTGPGGLATGTIEISNPAASAQAFTLTTTFTNYAGIPGSCVLTGAEAGATCTVTAGGLTASGNILANTTLTVTYQAQVATVPPGTVLTASNVATLGGATLLPNPLVFSTTVNCPALGPGQVIPSTTETSDQTAGSVLIYNTFTSGATSGNTQNTRINITNTHPQLPAFVHLFFVAEGCSVADSYLCLTASQTASFLASDLDPGTSGYLVAVAVDGIRGCPTNFNYLIGDEYVKFSSGHAANLGAQAFSAIAGGLPACDGNSVTAQLDFNGVSYNRLPATLALSNVGSRADGNDTLLIVNRIGGNLGIGAATLGTLFGVFYDDSENALSFSVAGNCQLRNSITNNFPRTTPRFETFIPAGRTGWLKIFNQTGSVGITGAAINFNANAASSAGAFNQGHNLHGLTLNATNSYTIPVFPPSC